MDMDCDLDVLLCPTIHVDGGTYRIQSAGADFRFHAPAPSTRDELAELDDDEAEEDGDPSIVEEQRGGGAAPSFRSAVSAAEEVFGFIIGKGGKNKQSIEQDTGATLHFPPNNRGRGPPAKSGKSVQSSTEVVVRGRSRAAVRAAKMRVEDCIDEALSSRRSRDPPLDPLS